MSTRGRSTNVQRRWALPRAALPLGGSTDANDQEAAPLVEISPRVWSRADRHNASKSQVSRPVYGHAPRKERSRKSTRATPIALQQAMNIAAEYLAILNPTGQEFSEVELDTGPTLAVGELTRLEPIQLTGLVSSLLQMERDGTMRVPTRGTLFECHCRGLRSCWETSPPSAPAQGYLNGQGQGGRKL